MSRLWLLAILSWKNVEKKSGTFLSVRESGWTIYSNATVPSRSATEREDPWDDSGDTACIKCPP